MVDKRITIHLSDGSERIMVVNWITVEDDGIIHFGRDELEFLAAPREHVNYWDGVYSA